MASLGNEALDKDGARELLKHLHILYPNGNPIIPVTNVDRTTVPEYKQEVIMFFDAVGRIAVDYNYNPTATYRMAYDDNKVSTANWTEIKQMLTCLGSSERFSFYNNARAIETGRIQRILLRLKQLVEQ